MSLPSVGAGPVARSRLVSGTWSIGIAQITGTSASYLLLPVLTRGLGSELYGTWVLVSVLMSYLTPWAGLGLSQSLLRFLPGYANPQTRLEAYRMIGRTSLAFSVFLAALLVLCATPLAKFTFGNPELRFLVYGVALLFPLETQLQLGQSYLQVQERFGAFAVLSTCRYIGELVLLAVLAWWWSNLGLMLGARVVIALAILAVQRYLMRYQISKPDQFLDPRAELSRYLYYGLPLIPGAFVWTLVMGLDRNMLNYFHSADVVGIYSASVMIAVVLLNYTRPLISAVQPRFSITLNQRPEQLPYYLEKTLRYLLLFLLPAAVVMGVAAGPLMRLAAGASFATGSNILPILAAAYVMVGLANPVYQVVLLQRGGMVFLSLYSLCLVCSLLLNLWLIPAYKELGAAWSVCAVFSIYVAGLVILSDQQTRRCIMQQGRTLGIVTMACAAMVLAMGVARWAHPVFRGLLQVPLGVLVYLVFIGQTKLIDAQERRTLLEPLWIWNRMKVKN